MSTKTTPCNLDECNKILDTLTSVFNGYKKLYDDLESQSHIIRAKLEAAYKEQGLSFDDALKKVREARIAKAALKEQEANKLHE